MDIQIATPKSHWSYADVYSGKGSEYIKSYIHYDYWKGLHTHSFYELNIILRGSGRHYLGEMSCEAKEGCVFVIPPYVTHGYASEAPMDIFHMLIHRDFFENCFEEFLGTEGYIHLFDIEPYLRSRICGNLFLVLTQEEQAQLRQDAALLETCAEAGEIYVNAAAKKLLAMLCMQMERRRAQEPQKENEPRNIAQCLNYIHRNFGEKITLDSLAKMLGMSRSTFIRQFQRVCSCPPHQYIQGYRLKKAKEAINCGRSITEAAHECGFYDASHLRKLLEKEEKGSPPLVELSTKRI